MFTLCRLCLRISTDSHQLFATRIGEKLIIEMIWTTFGIQLDECDKLPSDVCDRCLKKVENLSSFHEEVINSQTQLNAWKESGLLDATLMQLRSIEASQCPSDSILLQVKQATNIPTTRNVAQQHNTSLPADRDKVHPNYIATTGTTAQGQQENTKQLSDQTSTGKPEKSVSKESNENFDDNNVDQSTMVKTNNYDNKIGDGDSMSEASSGQNTDKRPQGKRKRIFRKCVFLENLRDAKFPHYQRHFRMHKCQQCKKRFPTAATLKNHVGSKHMKTKKNTCRFCGVVFVQENNLKKHMSIHNIPNPFKCKTCSKRFISSAGWRWHINNFHKQKLENSVIEPLLKTDLMENDTLRESTAETYTEKSGTSSDNTREPNLDDDISKDIELEELDIKEEIIVEELPENVTDTLLSDVCENVIESNEIKLTATDTFRYRYSSNIQDEVEAMFIAHKYNFPMHLRRGKSYPRLCEEPGCKYMARSVKLMRNHHQYHYKAFQCRECSKKFPTKGMLINHIEVEHLKTRKFQCNICHKVFKNKYSFEGHKHNETRAEVSLKCILCHVTFANWASLNEHHYRNHSALNARLNSITNEQQENLNEPIEVSKRSSGKFDNRNEDQGDSAELLISRLSADVNGVVRSGVTNEMYKQFEAKPVRLIKNLIFPNSLRNANSYPRRCLQRGCDYVGKTIHTMLSHYQRHFKMFKCQQCERRFATAATLREHIKSRHLKTKKNTCNICGENFSDKNLLTEHMSTHKTVKRHIICQVCGKTFNFSSGYKYHMNKFHKLTQQNSDIGADSEADSKENMTNCEIVAESDTQKSETSNEISDEQIFCNDTSSAIKLESPDTEEKSKADESPAKTSHLVLSTKNNPINFSVIDKIEKMCIVSQYHFPVHLRGGHSYPRTCEEPHCSYMAKTVKLMRIHHQNHYKAYQCRECQKKMPTKSLLRNHVEAEHLKTRIFEHCPFCAMSLNSVSSWRWHIKKFHEGELNNLQHETLPGAGTVENNANHDIPVESDIEKTEENNDVSSEQILWGDNSLDIKQEVIDIEEELIVDKSSENTADGTVESDDRNLSSTDTQDKVAALCIFLEYSFPMHLRRSNTYPRTCEEPGCKYVAKTVGLMRVHHQNHYKTYQCRECLRRFPKKYLLRNHIEVEHLKTLIYKCNICHKSYKQEYSFKIHKLQHEQVGTSVATYFSTSSWFYD